MGRAAVRSIVAVACAAMLASCATNLVAEDATVRMAVHTYRMTYPTTDSPIAPRVGLPNVPEPVKGATCVLSNDAGRWAVVTPATVEVPHSAATLVVECNAPGFKTAWGRVACVSKGMWGWSYAYVGVGIGASLLAMNAGHGGSLTKEGAVIVGLATATALYGISQASAPDANHCRYGRGQEARIDVELQP